MNKIFLTFILGLNLSLSSAQTSLATLESEMVFVQGGTMMMNHGGVSKNVLLYDFYCSKYEVTQRLWQEVMGDNPSFYGGKPDNPVERVDWYSCVIFCNELSRIKGRTPRYYKDKACTIPITKSEDYSGNGDGKPFDSFEKEDANGYRLPLETEWQYAASGGTLSHGYTYSGSNNIDEVAWYSGNNTPKGTKPVGKLKPNELGLYDMSGNVHEWTFCVYGKQSSQACGDLTEGNGVLRVIRGNANSNYAMGCEVTDRSFHPYPNDRMGNVGFRLVSQ